MSANSVVIHLFSFSFLFCRLLDCDNSHQTTAPHSPQMPSGMNSEDVAMEKRLARLKADRVKTGTMC